MISGENHPSFIDTTLCWLSPTALALVEKLRGSDGANAPCVAYYCCQSENWTNDNNPPTFLEALSSIISQILKHNPRILRTQYKEFKEEAKSEQWKHRKHGIPARFRVLKKALNLLDRLETVYVVLDRADRCEGDRALFLEGLRKLVGEDGVVVKVFVVMDSTGWPEDDHIQELKKNLDRKRFIRRSGWVQEDNIRASLSLD
jgi:hypothetical protein